MTAISLLKTTLTSKKMIKISLKLSKIIVIRASINKKQICAKDIVCALNLSTKVSTRLIKNMMSRYLISIIPKIRKITVKNNVNYH